MLYHDGAYPPQFLKVSDAADVISVPGERQKAIQAIKKTALDDFSPVRFVEGTNRTAVSFRAAPIDQILIEAQDWIEMWDEDELPPGLR